MPRMRVALRWAALLAVLVAATAQQGGDQDTGGQGGCGDHGSECEGCLASGCAWQPNTGGDCYSDCLIMDTSCYTGEPAACPQSEELCAGKSTCEECTAAGCIFQSDTCQPECMFGPLGDVIAVCARDAAGCEALSADEDTGGPPVIDTSGCVRHNGDCSACLGAGCVYQPVLDGQCLGECHIMDTTCYTSGTCPPDPLDEEEEGVPPAPRALPQSTPSSIASATPGLLAWAVMALLVHVLVILS
mmetsp:Transcript_39148/g.100037  ORF Transcript_39148/g.100037 Transcript_39148/m.100037 type:complete len:245 (-) Transcript_39148:222-956(-)